MTSSFGEAAGAVILAAVESTQLTKDEEAFFARAPVSGVTLFARNIPRENYLAPVSALTKNLQSLRPASRPPLMIAIDQEGGRVNRMPSPFPNFGPAQKLEGGSTKKDALERLRAYAADVGRALKACGINTDFAPVMDVITEPTNTAIGDRSFATDSDGVIARGGAFLAGLCESGVLPCLKHFPGQGAAKVDTHEGSAVIDASRDLLMRRDVAPFKALIKKTPMVMIAHCIYPALCDKEAGRSSEIIQNILRRDLGFDGVVVSDDMLMGALPQDILAWQDILVEAVVAGCDLLLVCKHLERCVKAWERMCSEAAKSPAFAKRLEDAANRMIALRRRLSS